MNRKGKALFWGLSLILLLDQLTKVWVDRSLRQGMKIEAIPHLLDIVHYRNPGAAFGMLAGWDSHWRNFFFFAVSALAIGLLLYYLYKTSSENKGTILSLVLILGGAFSNLVDRMIRGNVVDFILVHWYDKTATFTIFGKTFSFPLVWPAFNVADSAISIGVVLLLIITLKSDLQSVRKSNDRQVS